jgi:methylated-DNA-[protein]-cysteine S-methyltransferase
MIYTTIDSPIGELLLAGRDGVTFERLHMQAGRDGPFPVPAGWRRDDDAFADARTQLREYFAGERHEFDVPLAPQGGAYQLRVWRALLEIPYGETTTYGELARRIGDPDGARSVGWANGSNPIAVIIPCHRVIGANGKLVGYGGGLENKRLLLDLEAGRLPLEVL